MSSDQPHSATVMAGIPATNASLYRQMRFSVGDPAAVILWQDATGATTRTTLILRDIEMHRARRHARVDEVRCPADFAPETGLSGDRETATAQSVAECLRRAGIAQATADRSLPLIYADFIGQAGITLECDLELGVLDRRQKDAVEIEHLRAAQQTTEAAMRMACEMVGQATADADGVLVAGGKPLTSERVRAAIDVFLLEQGFDSRPSIVACGPHGADSHNLGSGPLRTGTPVIIDIFPQDRESLYNGDCTRTVVHGEITEQMAAMHAAVVAAKAAGIAACKPGVTGEDVHKATIEVISSHGFSIGLPGENDPDTYCGMVHGTGHGVGLDVHEPPLLDFRGPELLVGDILTVEPGVYMRAMGGVRVEDMVVVTQDGCENFNQLPEGLTWA